MGSSGESSSGPEGWQGGRIELYPLVLSDIDGGFQKCPLFPSFPRKELEEGPWGPSGWNCWGGEAGSAFNLTLG